MSKHFLKEIEIKNFKCFDDFKADGFGRVNLIGGKNNVGKTAFMEACYTNVCAQDINSFLTALADFKYMRESLNLYFKQIEELNQYAQSFYEKSNNIFAKSNINEIFYKIHNEDGVKKYFLNFLNQTVEININEFSFEINLIENIDFIDNFGQTNTAIINNYSFLQKKDQELALNTILNNFDSKINSFKIIDDKPQCKINDKYLEITELGDGVRHLVSIVTSIFATENGYLFIDEMDNGIHYTMLDELWENIIYLSKKLNVQVFATTHSKECIEAFNRVQKKLDDKETIYHEMAKNIKTDKIFMRALDSNQLEYELTHQGKYRGE